MTQKKLLWSWVLVLGIVHTANIYALAQHFFIDVAWIDIPFHLAGGVGVGFLALWFVSWTGIAPLPESKTWLASRMRLAFPDGSPWWWTFGAVAVTIGLFALGWEVFEACFLYFPRQPFPDGYPLDTMKDIMNGCIGATLAWAAFYRVQLHIWQKAQHITQAPSHSMEAPVR